jgi:hypothetical protein
MAIPACTFSPVSPIVVGLRPPTNRLYYGADDIPKTRSRTSRASRPVGLRVARPPRRSRSAPDCPFVAASPLTGYRFTFGLAEFGYFILSDMTLSPTYILLLYRTLNGRLPDRYAHADQTQATKPNHIFS